MNINFLKIYELSISMWGSLYNYGIGKQEKSKMAAPKCLFVQIGQ